MKVIARKGSLKTAVAGWLVDWRCWEILTFIRPAAAAAATDGYKKFISLRVPRLGRLPPQCARLLTYLYLVYVARLCGKMTSKKRRNHLFRISERYDRNRIK